MKKGRVLTVAFLSILLLLSSTACTPDDPGTFSSPIPSYGMESNGKTVYDTFSLPYNSGEKLNPFVTQSALNQALSQLIALEPVRPDGMGGGYNRLALAVTASADYLTYTLTLRPDLTFSDGTPLTAQDVAASALQAKKQTNGSYSARLRNLLSVTATDGQTAVFTLSTSDPCFAAMLSFPVVKGGSAEEDFIGSGPYCLTKTEEGTLVLTANPLADEPPKTKTIRLVGTENAALLHNLLEQGDIDCYYTDTPGKTAGSFAVSECDTLTDGLLAFDMAGTLTRDAAFRTALSETIDRSRLLSESGLFATLPKRNDTFLAGTGCIPTPEETAEPTPVPTEETLSDCLTSLGYTETDENGYRYKQQGRYTWYATLTLAYLSDNGERDKVAETLVTSLNGQGIQVTAIPYDSMTALTAGLAAKPADMVYAELALSPNLNLSSLLDPETGLLSLLHGDGTLQETYRRYLAGQVSGGEMDDAFRKTAAFTFLYSRKGRMLYSRLFSEGVGTTRFCTYDGVETWYKYD